MHPIARGVLICLALACTSNAGGTADGGGSPAEAGVAPADGESAVACPAGQGFSACVMACGEESDSVAAAARCEGGRLVCDPPRRPAAACSSSSWTNSRLPCGPWVNGYNCGNGCAVCAPSRVWTCLPCPDAGAGD